MSYGKHTTGSTCQGCLDRLKEGHAQLTEMFNFIKSNHPEVHTCWVHRGEADQESMFLHHLTEEHFPHSKHNSLPSLAMDIFQLSADGKAIFFHPFYKQINDELLAGGYLFRWGGTFKSLSDADHFEIA